MLKKELFFAGGDLRSAKLAEMFAQEGYIIHTYGLENYDFKNNNIIKEERLKLDDGKIISAIPFSKDDKYLNAPFAKEPISIKNLFEKAVGKEIIVGAVKQEIYDLANTNNCKLYDILDNEKLTILNVIPTAEGAIQVAMEESEETIHGNNAIVLGFGRIGKVLSKMLVGIGANVYVEARKKEDLAYINAYGYNMVDIKSLKEYLPRCKYIFNTIPHLILDKNMLEYVASDAIIIDLASKPGGVDFEYAKQKNIKAILAFGLPGRVAPYTAAKYIKETVEDII